MSAKITTPFGEALPPGQRHAITFHLPDWSHLLRLIDKDPTLIAGLKSVYPRMIPAHVDVKTLLAAILKFLNTPETHTALMFVSPTSANDCLESLIRPPYVDDQYLPAETKGPGSEVVTREDLSIHVLQIEATGTKFYTVVFPLSKRPDGHLFWASSGTGISSRLAEECLSHISTLRKLPANTPYTAVTPSPAHLEIKDRIATLLERSPVRPRHTKVTRDDVYLFQTGMTAIYKFHKYLLLQNKYAQKSALFGFAFHSTLHVFSDFDPGNKLFGRGTDAELASLISFLQTEKDAGRKVQAIWAEFPTNPSLTVANVARLREIADEFGALLVLDETIASFCNVDLLGEKGVDVLISSLTKSFSGYADVMGGSAVLNPLRSRYGELKELFERNYELDLCGLDAAVMASNSRDYLARSTIINSNTLALVNYFLSKSEDPECGIKAVMYPTTDPSYLANYKAVQRPVNKQKGEEFEPGFGCLFSIEFTTLQKMKIFYEHMNLHIGPHLGAHRTLAVTYVKGLYGKELEWAAGYGLKETMMRIAPGLEDVNDLIGDFDRAIGIMDASPVEDGETNPSK